MLIAAVCDRRDFIGKPYFVDGHRPPLHRSHCGLDLPEPLLQKCRMKSRLLLLTTLFVLIVTDVKAAEPVADRKIQLVIIGDSTVCNYPTNAVKRGWGMYIQNYFNSNQVQVIDLALSGRSTKTFINQGHWAGALRGKPDYILIQFGHNDSHAPEKPEATDAATTFRQYLRQYIDEARGIGARPVLITPMCRRIFQADGRIKNELLPYANAMKAVALEKKVPLVDLNLSSVALCDQLGQKASDDLACDSQDQTHFNAKGAQIMAGLVMHDLAAAEPSLKPYEIAQ
jgi:lysophospholipase L1-like esterase